ncbi:NAD(+) diphosphatase [Flagellimonas profundi]|uniref:NAD(+) diphosphatase n=1 Tax=Flagellimonas profundi TaxID=2915620 RepID=A0ABS3FJX8_9FLAO|nr:NAD(+) diphosphatase [Allomuricauda profundi]MBO0343500.1 NAD(+) diphosphatase [Allomuricauda profundi]
MNDIQFYSNKDFNRAVESREIKTKPLEISFIPIYKDHFFSINYLNSDKVVMNVPSELTSLSEKKYYLGITDNKEVWCIDLSEIKYATISNFLTDSNLCCLRDCFHVITEKEASLLAYAKGIAHWNKTHQFCNNCGSKTITEEKGHRRKCSNSLCNSLHFPRINPAVIVLIEYKQENSPSLCLLNMHQKEYGYMCSLFSGFSEIGESLEDTVIREMKEELSVAVTNIKYIASQPWTFPSSMMLGFSAETKNKNFKIDNKEIKEAHWFSANQIIEMVQDNKLVISKKDSISNYLIEKWVRENS